MCFQCHIFDVQPVKRPALKDKLHNSQIPLKKTNSIESIHYKHVFQCMFISLKKVHVIRLRLDRSLNIHSESAVKILSLFKKILFNVVIDGFFVQWSVCNWPAIYKLCYNACMLCCLLYWTFPVYEVCMDRFKYICGIEKNDAQILFVKFVGLIYQLCLLQITFIDN